MGTIVAIGGGSIGRAGKKVQTTAIDKQIIRLSGKKKPIILFIPTASSDDPTYVDAFRKQYGIRLGCTVRVLYLKSMQYPRRQLKEIISSADIIYVGGGNTLMMMNLWKRLGVDTMLRDAHRRGTVLCGPSAGGICWFRWGNSDSRQYTNKKAKRAKMLIRVGGLGLHDLLFCPHYDTERYRRKDLKRMMKTTPGVAIAVEDCAALEITGNRWRIIGPKRAYRAYWSKKQYHTQLLPKKYRPLGELTRNP